MINRRNFLTTAGAVGAATMLSTVATGAAAQEMMTKASGTFEGRSNHVTSGSVKVIVEGDRRFVELGDDFSLDGGPDPRVGFGKDGEYLKDAYLGALLSLNGKQRYAVPSTWKVGDYNEVYIWCEVANVPLGVDQPELTGNPLTGPIGGGWRRRLSAPDLFDRQVAIGIDADICGDGHGGAGDLFGGFVGVHHAARGGEGEVATRANRRHVMFGLQHITGAGDHVKLLAVSDDQHRFELLQIFVGAPVLGQFDRGTLQLARRGLKLAFQPLQQGEGIGGGPGKARDHVIAARREAADLAGGALDHGLAEADLTVTGDHHLAALAHADDGGAVPAGELIVCHLSTLSIVSRSYMAAAP